MSDENELIEREVEGIFDWAIRLSLTSQLLREAGELSSRISNIGRVCGDCSKWMKTRECPRERPTPSGRNKGPSMNDSICREFSESFSASRLRETLKGQREEKLRELESLGTRNTTGTKQ